MANSQHPDRTTIYSAEIHAREENIDSQAEIGHLRASSRTITYVSEKTDRLFDICHCKCTIHVTDCANCNVQAHVTCICPKEVKIPKSELMFLLTQREKERYKSKMNIGGEDVVASRRHASLNARKAKQEYKQYGHGHVLFSIASIVLAMICSYSFCFAFLLLPSAL